MLCLKCGKETAENQVFCDDCLEVMQAYPVKPGTAIHLPHRELPSHEKKPSRRQEAPQADQLSQLRVLIRCLAATIAVLSVLLCATAAMLIHTLDRDSAFPGSAIGRNYTTADSGNQP